MRKLTMLVLILLLLFGCSAKTYDPISTDQLIGKTVEEVSDYIVLKSNMLVYGYGFGTDLDGNPLVLEWEIDKDDRIVITAATVFDKRNIDKSSASFEALKEGMTIYQVVEKIGIPSSIPNTGVFYLVFFDSKGMEYWLWWYGDPLCLGEAPLR